MYDRRNGEQELQFEASGALERASLVMRDVETDSWWSIMSSEAIGGELEGAALRELDVSRKAQWKDWVAEHPETLVLSIEGTEHVENDPYANYFTGEETFRGVTVDDDRLPAKEPIYATWWDGDPVAVAHTTVESGHVEFVGDSALVFWRAPEASVFASTETAVVARKDAEGRDARQILDAVAAGSIERRGTLEGFDTYWYTWVNVNRDSRLVTP